MSHYSDWAPNSREYSGEEEALYESGWQAPDYGVLDFHAYYDMPFTLGPVKPQLYLHVFNALDETYIQDAVDNSSYNGWDQSNSAEDAEVFFGLPMSFNAGLSLTF